MVWFPVKCLKQGIKIGISVLSQGRKISDFCLKQGQGIRGAAAPPHPRIYRVPPRGNSPAICKASSEENGTGQLQNPMERRL